MGVFPLEPNGVVEFDTAPVTAYTATGTAYMRWVSYGMPKLGEYQYLLDTVFFLYEDVAGAKAGERAGGTGFFVTVPSEAAPQHYHHLYAVTNRHVASSGLDGHVWPVIRVNTHKGPPEIFPFEPHEWHFIPKNHDIAVIPIDLNPSVHKAEALDLTSFCLTNDDIGAQDINAADDVFMLGRFIDYDGVEMNAPAMRFGNISMMAAPIEQLDGFKGDSIVVDMHSRTGFSGSPVFVYRTAGSVFAKPNTIMGGGHLLKLLGILWGQFPEKWPLKKDEAKHNTATAVFDGRSVIGWSGMSLVCPAAAIWSVLNMPKLKARRQAIEHELQKKLSGAPIALGAQLADTVSPSETPNPHHKEDFTSLLDAAARMRPQAD